MRRAIANRRVITSLASLSTLAGLGLSACAGEPAEAEPSAAGQPELIEAQSQALFAKRGATARLGQKLFERALPDTNGRSCATCHVQGEGFTLQPASVEARLRDNPTDPLFNRLDADDPNAPVLSFEALKKGLIRVVIKLPDNVDVIDAEGAVVTAPDRTIFVWRGVPSVADTAITAPYQLDGREATLEQQAQNALIAHSEGRKVSALALERLAGFQQSQFTSSRARFVATLLDFGVHEENIPMPEDFMALTAAERRGRDVYKAACAGCHGGATTDRVIDRSLHKSLSPAFTPEGNVRFSTAPGKPPEPVLVERPGVDFMNAGFGAATYVGQIGIAPSFNASIPLPRYRFRFYTDGSRTQRVVDLPGKPVTVSGSPFDLRPALDENGAPIVGPNLIPQAFTTDPGRAVITGDPADFEAFDIPQLRGIARTAPYFHDNSRETLRDVIDEYSRFLLPFLKTLNLPAQPPEQPGGRPEALSPVQKNDLLAFLNRL